MERKRNRSLESCGPNSEKVSPPSKMNKANSSSVTLADVMKEILEIKDKTTKIEADNKEFQKWAKEIKEIKEQVGVLKAVVDDYRRSEIEAKKACVLIKGLKILGSGKFETRTETRERLRELFSELGGFRSHMFDYYRLGGKKDNDDDGTQVPIRVIFVDVDQKYELFDLLRTHGKNPNVKKVQVLNDYPKFQVAVVKRLNQKGYELRQQTQGLRTRIVPRGISLVLQTRINKDDKWTTVRD